MATIVKMGGKIEDVVAAFKAAKTDKTSASGRLAVGFAEYVGSEDVTGTVCELWLGFGVGVTGAGVLTAGVSGAKVSSAAPSDGTSCPSVKMPPTETGSM